MSRKFNSFKLFICCVAPILLSSCGFGFLGEKQKKVRVEGERKAIIAKQIKLAPDDSLNEISIQLPAPKVNANWPQRGGISTHALKHVQLGDAPERVWQSKIGEGGSKNTALTAAPIVFNGMVMTLDTAGKVRAFALKTGELRWETILKADENAGVFGGGMGSGQNKIFISLGSGELIALNIQNGKELWRVSTRRALRSAPSYADGRIFVTTLDNMTLALSASTGVSLWSHNGMIANAALLGAASPAIKNNKVILAYSSGELYALQTNNGRIFWGDNLSAKRGSGGVARISHVRGNPVIDENMVFATSHSGRLLALELKTGRRLWQLPIASRVMPWVAGNYLYIVTTGRQLICLTKRDGRVKWITNLPEFSLKDSLPLKTEKIVVEYSEPVLAGDRLIIASSIGKIYSVSPYTGQILGETQVDGNIFIEPIVADKTLLLLDKQGNLTAFR
ncbi:PQQ-binding-like beta-propeller repeat protein [Rhodospirillaceae bacterium]|nr:PQQ-binding-like beta-propeller repeat protein [Rhodospirillaceae bacterium]